MSAIIDLFGRSMDDEDDVQAQYDSFGEGTFVATRGMYPVQLVFIVTGSYNPVVRRSFEVNANEDSIRSLDDAVNHSANAIGVMSLAGVSNEIIRPSARIDREINIKNGWDEPRCRFYMTFKRPMGQGSYLAYNYTGFTDYAGVSESGHIDEDMPMHITSITVTRHSLQHNRTVSSVTKDQSVLVSEYHYADKSMDDIANQYRANGRIKEYVMDPANVAAHDFSIKSMMDMDVQGHRILPESASIGRRASTMNRAYNIPSYYLSRMINVKQATDNDDAILDSYADIHDAHLNASRRQIDTLRASTFSEDPLASLYDSTGFDNSATIAVADLKEYFPTILDETVCKIIFPAGLQEYGVSSRNFESALRNVGQYGLDADHWRGSNQETIIATMIAQQLPNLMVSEFITSIRFTVTNDVHSTLTESYAWVIGDDRMSRRSNRSAVMFVANIPTELAQRRLVAFKQKVEDILLNPMTMNGLIVVHLMVDCDVHGECTIYITLDNGNEYKYIMPTFADAMSSPLITTSLEHFNDFTKDIVSTVERVV